MAALSSEHCVDIDCRPDAGGAAAAEAAPNVLAADMSDMLVSGRAKEATLISSNHYVLARCTPHLYTRLDCIYSYSVYFVLMDSSRGAQNDTINHSTDTGTKSKNDGGKHSKQAKNSGKKDKQMRFVTPGQFLKEARMFIELERKAEVTATEELLRSTPRKVRRCVITPFCMNMHMLLF